MFLPPEAPTVSPELALMLLDNMKRVGECIEWTGRRTSYGHGMLYANVHQIRDWSESGLTEFDRSPIYAHRVAFSLFHGPIPYRLVICHKCDNPPCFNPKHLFLGTYKDNVADSQNKGRRPIAEWNKSAVCLMCEQPFIKITRTQHFCSRHCFHLSTKKRAA